MSKITSLRVTKKTRNRLSEIGSKDETFDEILRRLIDFYNDKTGIDRLTKRRVREEATIDQ